MRIVTEFPHAVEVVENLFIPMPDGVLLAAKLWRPIGAKTPALLEYLPYRKRDGTRARDNGLHAYFAGHGFACLRVDIRGTGDSDGVITGEYTEQELLDGETVLAWIAAQDFCDGHVAMIGISWGGFNGLQLAARQPPALKTIITVGSTDDRYATDVHWVGGCLSKDNFDWSATMLASNDLPPDPAVVGDRWRAMWVDRMQANRPWALDWMAHQRRDEHWQQGSVCEDFAAIRIPVYAVSGWADNYSEAVPRLLAGLTCPRLGLIGPWAHSYPHDANVAPAIGWLQEVRRWLDHWLKGQATGIMDEPMLRVWMQDGVPPQACYTARPGRWVGEAVWPSPRIQHLTLPLNPGGSLGGASGAGTARINSPLWVGLGAGEIGRYGADADWAVDQREDDAGSLVFFGPVLTETLEILGAPHVTLRFRSDRPLALVSARLNDVAPDGRSTRVSLGMLNLTHRASHEHAEKLTPGAWTEAAVDLDDIAHSFAPGHRIAVSLSTTYWPIAWPSPEPVTLDIALGTSSLTLPHRPESPDDAQLRPFDPPEAAAQCPVIWQPVTPPRKRSVTRDLLTGRTTVDFPRWCYACEMPDIATTQRSTGYVRYHITEGDPLSAEMQAEYTTENQRPDGTFGHWHRGRMWCDAAHFHLETDLKVSEDGAVIFENSWRESIPRDHI